MIHEFEASEEIVNTILSRWAASENQLKLVILVIDGEQGRMDLAALHNSLMAPLLLAMPNSQEATRAHYLAGGQRYFFSIALRLLLQDKILFEGQRLPIVLDSFWFWLLNADWFGATWRMISVASGPIAVAVRDFPDLNKKSVAPWHDLVALD